MAKRRTKAQYAYDNSGRKIMPCQGGEGLEEGLGSGAVLRSCKHDIYRKEGKMLKEEYRKMEVGCSGWHHIWEDTF